MERAFRPAPGSANLYGLLTKEVPFHSMRTASLSLLTTLCLVLAVAPAMADYVLTPEAVLNFEAA